MMAAKMSHSKAGVTKAVKGGAVAEGDVPRAGKSAMTDSQYAKYQSAKTSAHQSAIEARKGTAVQSGMFRQLTGGLESVITAIVEAMPGNVKLHNNTFVDDIQRNSDRYELHVMERSGCECLHTDIGSSSFLSPPSEILGGWSAGR